MPLTFIFSNSWTTKIRSARTYIFIFNTQVYGNVHELNANNIKKKKNPDRLTSYYFFNVAISTRK